MYSVVEGTQQQWCCSVSSSFLSKRIPYGDCVGKPQTQSSICDISSYNNPHAENQGKSAHIVGGVGDVGISSRCRAGGFGKVGGATQGSSSAKGNEQQRGTLMHKQPARGGAWQVLRR